MALSRLDQWRMQVLPTGAEYLKMKEEEEREAKEREWAYLIQQAEQAELEKYMKQLEEQRKLMESQPMAQSVADRYGTGSYAYQSLLGQMEDPNSPLNQQYGTMAQIAQKRIAAQQAAGTGGISYQRPGTGGGRNHLDELIGRADEATDLRAGRLGPNEYDSSRKALDDLLRIGYQGKRRPAGTAGQNAGALPLPGTEEEQTPATTPVEEQVRRMMGTPGYTQPGNLPADPGKGNGTEIDFLLTGKAKTANAQTAEGARSNAPRSNAGVIPNAAEAAAAPAAAAPTPNAPSTPWGTDADSWMRKRMRAGAAASSPAAAAPTGTTPAYTWPTGTATDWHDTQGVASWVDQQRSMGLYSGNEPWRMNEQQIQENIEKLQKLKEQILADQTKTQEEKERDIAALNEQQYELTNQIGIYNNLIENGLDRDYQAPEPDGTSSGRLEHISTKTRPEDYYDGNNRDLYDKLLYDTIYGDGAYEKRMEALETDEDVDTLESEMDQLWDDLESGGFAQRRDELQEQWDNRQSQMAGQDPRIKDIDRWLGKYQTELDNRSKQKELEQIAKEKGGDGAYNSAIGGHRASGNDWRGIVAGAFGGINGDEADKTYYLVNHPEEGQTEEQRRKNNPQYAKTQELMEKAGISTGTGGLGQALVETSNTYANIYKHMTPEQVKNFNILYGSGSEEEKAQAMEYIGTLEDQLQNLQYEYEEKRTREDASGKYGAFYGAKTILSKPLDAAMGTVGTVLAALGDESAGSKTSPWMKQTHISDTTRQARAEEWDKAFVDAFGEGAKGIGEFLNNGFYSLADMTMARLTSGAITNLAGAEDGGKLGEAIMQFVMSSEAAASTMLEKFEQNMDPQEAALYAIGSGIIEAVTEKYSIEKFLHTDIKNIFKNGDLAKYVFKNMIAEGSEEVASDALNLVMDQVMSRVYQHEDEVSNRYNELLKEYKDPNKASEMVLLEELQGMGTSFLAGALSSLVSSGGIAGINAAQIRSENRSEAKTANAQGRVRSVIDAALGIKGDEKYEKKIEGYKTIWEKNGKLTTRETMDLFKTIRATGSDVAESAIQAEAADYSKEQIKAAMEQNGTTADAETIQAASEGAAQLLTGDGELTGKQKKAMQQIPEAMDFVSGMMGEAEKQATLKDRIKRATGSVTDAMNSIREATAAPQARTDADYQGNVATEEDISRAEGTRTNDSLEAIAAGVFGNIQKIEGGKVRTADGRLVDISDVKATNATTAKILNFAALDKNRMSSDKFNTTLLQYSKMNPSETLLQDAMNIRIATMLGKSMPQNNLDEATANALRDASLADFNEAEEKRIQGTRSIQPGQGTASYNGVAYGREGWSDAIQGLSRNDRRQADAIGQLAQAAGFNVTIINDASQDAMYGSAGDSGIIINLAGTEADGQKHHALVTFGHEITHMLEKNSREGYASLREYVLNTLEQKGMNVEQRITHLIDTYGAQGEDIDINGAIAEIVANGCDQVLSDESAIRHLQQTNESLYGKIKGAVMDLVNRVKKAIAGMSGSASRESGLLLDNLNEIVKRWTGAYDESLTAAQNATGKEATGTSAQLALRDKNKNVIPYTEKEKTDNRKKVNQMEPIVSIDQKTIDRFKTGNLMESGSKYFDEIGRIAHNDILGDVALTNSGIRHIIIKKTGLETQSRTLAAIKPVIENGHIVHIDNNHSGKSVDTAVIAGKINLPDGGYYVAVVVAQDNGGTKGQNNRYSFHDAMAIKEGTSAGSMASADASGSVTSNSDSYIFNILQDIQNINTQKSLRVDKDGDIVDNDGNAVAKELRGGSVSQYSMRTWEADDIEALADRLVKQGFSRKNVKKWIQDVNDVAAKIAEKRDILDYKAVTDSKGNTFFPMLKNNQEYVKTLDASTLCAKRLLYQGIFNEIQHMLPNTPILPEDLIKLVNMMKKRGLVTPCGICYVESRRRNLGKFANEWLKNYEGAYKPTLDQVTTTDGLEKLRMEHPETYQDFVDAMNSKGSSNPKVVQLRTEYNGDIRKMTDAQIRKVKEIGGLRVQSFSDFETPHLIDMMQAVMDMAAADLTSQAYTKVPNFARVFGGTGIKINMSLIGDGNGLDENGNLIFSSIEGMDFDEAMKLRNMYSKNVGTILVGMNDDHIIKAMGDDRIDFIIPFHKSGWSKKEMAQVNGMSAYKDYTRFQNEKKIDEILPGGKVKTIPNKKSKISNFGPVGPNATWDGQNGYWDFKKTGIQNAERYLELCKADRRVPKFANFLQYDGNGGYSLPTDMSERSQNIRKGYWKLLIDFKMYDNNGKGSPQTEVKPNFNMEAAMDVLNSYEGGANTLPTNHDVAEQFVKEYKAEHPGRKQFSVRDVSKLDVGLWMNTVNENSLQTEAEKQLLREYRNLRMRYDLYSKRANDARNKMREIEAVPEDQRTKEQKRMLQNLSIREQNARGVAEQAMQKMNESMEDEGFARLMYQQRQTLENFIYGKTQAEVRDSVEAMERNAQAIQQRITKNQAALDEIQKSGVMQKVKSILGTTTVDQAATDLKKHFNSSWSKTQIRNFLDPILLKMSQGEDFSQDIERLASEMIASDKSRRIEELEPLRGMTITIGPGQMAELKGQNSSLEEIRRRLAGTGIRIQQGEYSSLERDIDDLRQEFPQIPELGNEKDALENFLSWVEGLKDQTGSEFYAEALADAIGVVAKQAASAASGIYLPTDSRARSQVLELVEYIKGLQGVTKEAQRTLTQVAEQMGQMTQAGKAATGRVNMLARDVNVAIDYYNRTAQMAEDTMRKQRTTEIIQQLKSEQAQKLLKVNEEWRDLIERDRQARKQMEVNAQERGKINTNVTRLYKLLNEPKGSKNIPEELQGLAREIIGTFVGNDLGGGLKITKVEKKQLKEAQRRLYEWEKRDGSFNIGDLNEGDEDAPIMIINQDLQTIYDTLEKYNNGTRGKNKLDTLQQQGETLKEMSEAVAEIAGYIQSRREITLKKRKVAIQDQAYKVMEGTRGRRAKEWTGRAGQIISGMDRMILHGNMTPEYFFRGLRNEGLSELWDGYHDAENRNGLELKKAQTRIGEIAEKHGYKDWDMKQKVTLDLESGKVDVTLGQLMSLYAIWNREHTLGPEMSQHLEKGGFYAEQDTRDGLIGRQEIQKRAYKVSEEDAAKIANMLTEEQKDFVNDIVGYMSNDMSQLGNEASMAAYGIKMYKESYYFPMQMWDGIKSRKSNEGASAAAAQDRAFHPSFSKTRMHGAQNALVIGDFMQTATDHITGMINYATMGLANENFQKVLNAQMVLNEGEKGSMPNIRTLLEEAYGKEAINYLKELQLQLNGGAVKTSKSLGDKAISLFRKNAVAGSLSVAAQQPLSYIRAASMINPKYLAQGLAQEYWKGSYEERLKHSGVSVIKDMGRFDMNAGQSAREFLMPEGKEGKARAAYEKAAEMATILPELMDRWTWNRMWVAVKAEQKAQHPEMDIKSDEFLDMCGERFNELMRRTQVYDSTLVKSQNMRSDNYWVKGLTSFMAEPTVTLNVLADAVRSAKEGEKGGKIYLGKAIGTFLLSAVAQAAVKAGFSTGRTPDDKKTWLENFLYRFGINMLSEANPATMIPGYNDLVTLIKEGKLEDDAMGAIGKLGKAWSTGKDTISSLLSGESTDWYKGLEDSAGQIAQLFSNIPAKNIMRDMRAMYNWMIAKPYADRATDASVIKYQWEDAKANADWLTTALIDKLGIAGYDARNKAYYERIYQAKKAGNEQQAQDMIDYLLNGKGVSQETIDKNLKSAMRKDESLSAADRAAMMTDEGYDASDFIIQQVKAGSMTAAEARRQMKAADPKASEDSIWWKVDRAEYKRDTGKDAGSGTYYRLKDAISANKVTEIKTAAEAMIKHGVKAEDIKKELTREYRTAYLSATGNDKVKLKNALIMAYKAIEIGEEEANEIINKWVKDNEKDKKNSGTSGRINGLMMVGSTTQASASPEAKKQMMMESMYRNTEGELYGKGNIDLNKRKVVWNPDGSFSTEASFSVNIDGMEVLLPTVINGKIVSEEEAIEHYFRTGEYLGKFKTVEEAEEYAMLLHERQEWYYGER